MNLDQLQKIAEAATPGPWYLRTNRHTETDGRPWGWLDLYPPGTMRQASPAGVNVTWTRGDQSEKNAAYIAAASPDVLLRLIAVARAATVHFGAVDDRARACDSGEWLALSIAALDTESALRSAIAELDAQQEPTNG